MSIREIKPIYVLSRLTLTWPFRISEEKIVPLSFGEKLCCAITSVLHVLILAASLYKRYTINHIEVRLPEYLLDAISSIAATSLTLGAMLPCLFRSSTSNSAAFFKQLARTDRLLQIPEKSHEKAYIYFRNRLFAGLTFLILATLVDNYIWIDKTSFSDNSYYFHSYFMSMVNAIVTAQINGKIILLKLRFLELNNKLENLMKNAKLFPQISNLKCVYIKPIEETVRTFNKVYDILCDLVESVNKCHGIQIIILAFTILTVSLNTLVIAFMMFRQPSERNSAISILMQFIWTSYYIVLGVTLTNSTSTTTELSKMTSIMSHKLLLEYYSKNEEREYLHYSREELKLLIEQVAFRNPTFSASGFFIVDYTMLYAIVGAVTSYFIVLLQLQ